MKEEGGRRREAIGLDRGLTRWGLGCRMGTMRVRHVAKLGVLVVMVAT